MYIWNKVLVGLIFVMTIPFIIFAAQALKTHAYWRKAYNAHEERLAALSRENETLLNGTAGAEDGVRRLKLELHKMMMDRGRVWRKCAKQALPNLPGAMKVQTVENPSGITPKSIVYVFEEKPVEQGGVFLGEFQVAEVANNVLSLVPAMTFSQKQVQRIAKSQGTVTLYDFLPYDNHKAFAGLTDEQIKTLLKKPVRPETVREYLKDGKKAEANDPQNVEIEGVVVRKRRDEAGNYLRQLNDYEILLQSYHARLSLMKAHKEALVRDNRYLQAAFADAKLQQQFRESEKKELKEKQAEVEHELSVVQKHQERLEKKVAEIEDQIEQTMDSNANKAEKLAEVQAKAAELIEKRVQSIAKGDATR